MTQRSPRAAVDTMEPGCGVRRVSRPGRRSASRQTSSLNQQSPRSQVGRSGLRARMAVWHDGSLGPDGRLARREPGPGCPACPSEPPVRAGRRVGFIWARRPESSAVLASTGRNRVSRRTRSACPGRTCMLVPPTHRFWFSALGSRFHSMMSRPHWPTRAAAAAGALQFFAGRRGRSAGNAK